MRIDWNLYAFTQCPPPSLTTDDEIFTIAQRRHSGVDLYA